MHGICNPVYKGLARVHALGAGQRSEKTIERNRARLRLMRWTRFVAGAGGRNGREENVSYATLRCVGGRQVLQH